MSATPQRGWRLAQTWVEALVLWWCGLTAVSLAPRVSVSLSVDLTVLGVAAAALAVMSMLYAATRSPRPAAMRWGGYACAAAVLIAWLAL
ncbi:hypothetical protein [Streptosporangium sandarakinum]